MAIKTKWVQNNHAQVELKCDCMYCNNYIEVAVKTDGSNAKRIIDDAIKQFEWMFFLDDGCLIFLCNRCKPTLKAKTYSREFKEWLYGSQEERNRERKILACLEEELNH
jgi:hypothetical protein